LTGHLIEDVGRIVTVEDWAQGLMPSQNNSFCKFLAKKREQIEGDAVKGERELFGAFNLAEKDIAAVKAFLAFPLRTAAHPAALLVTHNSFAVYLAERIFGYAFVKNAVKSIGGDSRKQLIATREIFERLIFLRMKAVYSPAEIAARTAAADWMRGAEAGEAGAEKKRLATICE